MENLTEDKGIHSDFLLHGSYNIKDGDSQEGIRAMLNRILRTFYVYANRQHIQDDAVGDKEMDHFIEIQHLVKILVSKPGGSNPCNLFKIPKGLNQAKKDIPVTGYTPSQLHLDVKAYLDTKIEQIANSGEDKASTVGVYVERLIKGMAVAHGSSCNLVKAVDKCIANVMYPGHKLNLKDKLEAGFYTK